MRIVLDTNVLARAARGGDSIAAALLRLSIESPHLLVLSPILIAELSRVMRYDRMRAAHGLDDTGIDAYIAHLQSAALLVSPASTFPPMVVPHDPEDDPVVATAVTGKADVLCTRDRHLHHAEVRRYCEERGIRIVDDIILLPMLRE